MNGTFDDDPFEFGRAHGLRGERGIDRVFEQLFDTGFADGFAESTNLGGFIRKPGLVVGLASEVPPDDILGLT